MSFYKKVGENIKKYRELKGYTLEQIGNQIGVTKKTVQRYETGEIKLDMDRLSSIAKALGVMPSRLVSDTEAFFGIEEIANNHDFINLPVYEKISCGSGLCVMEEVAAYEATPKSWLNSGDYFYIKAKGDSMEGFRVHDGDLLLIRKQEDVENGEIAAVLLEDDVECMALLKRVVKGENQLFLESGNPKYKPILSPPAKVKIIGKLKKIVINM